MHLDNEKADERLKSAGNIANRFAKLRHEPSPEVTEVTEGKVTEITLHKPGKSVGSHNLPPFLRDTVAILARTGARQESIAEELGLAQPTVSQIKNGNIPTSPSVEEAIKPVRDLALSKLMTSMGLLTEEKLEKCKANELSNIAANMSRVVEKTLPREANQGAVVNLIVYKPELRSESSFRTIEV